VAAEGDAGPAPAGVVAAAEGDSSEGGVTDGSAEEEREEEEEEGEAGPNAWERRAPDGEGSNDISLLTGRGSGATKERGAGRISPSQTEGSEPEEETAEAGCACSAVDVSAESST